MLKNNLSQIPSVFKELKNYLCSCFVGIFIYRLRLTHKSKNKSYSLLDSSIHRLPTFPPRLLPSESKELIKIFGIHIDFVEPFLFNEVIPAYLFNDKSSLNMLNDPFCEDLLLLLLDVIVNHFSSALTEVFPFV